ncbi:MAG TPA: hypothetical protein VF180_02425 [Acidimicrobiia bacterium]
MLRRLAPLAAAAVAVSTLAIVPVPKAGAATASTCDGQKTHITGSGASEKFTLTKDKRIINAHGGNDIIETKMPRFPDHLSFPVTVCMGSGNDTLRAGDGAEGAPIRYLDGGKGFDTVDIYVCFEGNAGPKWTIRDVERITIINCLD